MIVIVANVFGFLGALLFACKSAPQIYDCWKKGSTAGLSNKMLFMDLGGNIFSFIYIFWLSWTGGIWAISNLLNYTIATIFLFALFYLMWKFRKHKTPSKN